jgi:hypothetical protein
MTVDPVANFVKVRVSTGYDSSATSIILQSGDGSKVPDPASGAYNLVWWNSTDYPDPADDPYVEIVRVTSISTDTLTITRAQEGTSASNKNTASKTYKMILAPTEKLVNDLDVVSGSLSVGGVLFANSSNKIIQDNLNIFWDNTNKNLGIGTTVPFAGLSSRHGLDILGSATYQSLLLNNSGTGGNAWELISANNADTNIGGKLSFLVNNTILGVLTSDGRLGLGTISPARPLTVVGMISHQQISNNSPTVDLYHDGSIGIIRTDYAGTASYTPLTFFTSNNERMRIDTGGNVGIGTTSPLSKFNLDSDALTLSGNMTLANSIAGSNHAFQIQYRYATGECRFLNYNNSGNTFYTFYTAHSDGTNAERMRINDSGKVGIGTTVPGSLLDIHVNSTESTYPWGTSELRLTNENTTNGIFSSLDFVHGTSINGSIALKKISGNNSDFVFWTNNGSGLAEKARITGTGNVGIGTPSPNATLHVNGSVSMNITTLTGNTTLDGTYYTVLCNATSAGFTVTLPTSVGITGRIYNIKKTDSSTNTVTIATTSSQTIDSSTNRVISTQYETITVQSDGSNWYII